MIDEELDLIDVEVTKEDVIDFINKKLTEEAWTDKEISNGKEIDVLPEWAPHIRDIVWDFKYAGWIVFHYIQGIREFVEFTNPNVKRGN